MQRTFKDELIEVLTAIDYPNDKEQFIAEFEQLNRLEALINLTEALPTEIQDAFNSSTSSQDIQKHFSDEEYKNEIFQVTKKAFQNFIQTIIPGLTNEQKEKVINLVSLA